MSRAALLCLSVALAAASTSLAAEANALPPDPGPQPDPQPGPGPTGGSESGPDEPVPDDVFAASVAFADELLAQVFPAGPAAA